MVGTANGRNRNRGHAPDAKGGCHSRKNDADR
jgi:hypothetical protein